MMKKKKKLYEQFKKELEEQNKIQNMNKNEYLNYSQGIKKEINSIKDTINNFKDLNDYFNRNKGNNIINKKCQTIDYENNKNKNEIKIFNYNDNHNTGNNTKTTNFNSNIFVSSKGMKSYSKGRQTQRLPNIINNLKKNENEKAETAPKNDIKIPKLSLNELSNSSSKNNIKKNNVYLSERKLREIQKEKKLNQLYDTLNNKKSNTIFPYKLINQYFTKYSPKRLPVANTDRGSNIHGLVDDVQIIVNDNNFASFAKLNNNAKKDIKKYKKDEYLNKKILDDEYIHNLDNKILGIHYDYTNKILSDKQEIINSD